MASHQQPNALINESSPYLLQHAYNPVHWLPFSDQAFNKAADEKKLVLVSVGYSACHWCHVMEHESFEDEQVAEVMNAHFVCIKVDREERADVDMLYMQAVQLMTGHGGWPLNCFVLPDGRPCYGGTYFNKQQWLQVLNALADLYSNQPEKVEQYAGELTSGIVRAESFFETPLEEIEVSKQQLQLCVDRWRKRFDNQLGGPDHAPKFPLPVNYTFLLRYATLSGDTRVMDHVDLTLTRMAFGGINDQVHGGFARYSVDMLWKVPHFEKMLYDNAQLASLYIEAFTLTNNPLYADTAKQILTFVEREWLTAEGAFYSAYDADSEGEEGKYYVWNMGELAELLGDDLPLFSRYFQINETGYWEHGNYILMRNPDFAKGEISPETKNVSEVIDRCLRRLRAAAETRVRPGLDDKVITSWNAMMCTAFAKAYLVFGEQRYRQVALSSIDFLRRRMRNSEGHLLRTYKNGNAKIHGFLDDYAFTIEALLSCYYISQDMDFLLEARNLTDEALKLYHNPASTFLFYASSRGEKLVTRTTEVSDNVIPSSNSQMAVNLLVLGHLFAEEEWVRRAGKMLSAVSSELIGHGASYGNWGSLALMLAWPLKEVAIVGKDVDEKLRGLYGSGITNAIFAVSGSSSDLPLLRERLVRDKTMIYVCENKTCALPVESVEEARQQID